MRSATWPSVTAAASGPSSSAAQCREGWHLETEPAITPDDPDDVQLTWITHRAETQHKRDHAEEAGQDTAELDELNAELDEEITRSGLRGNVLAGRPGGIVPPGADRTPPTCPGVPSTPGRSARPTPRRAGRSFARPCS
jgi:hypothetical protein